MSDNDGVPEADLEALRVLAAALPRSPVRPAVVFGELRARHEVTDTTVKVRMAGGRYVWVWDDGDTDETEVIDADPSRTGYVAAVAARVCRVLDVEPACVDGPDGANGAG